MSIFNPLNAVSVLALSFVVIAPLSAAESDGSSALENLMSRPTLRNIPKAEVTGVESGVSARAEFEARQKLAIRPQAVTPEVSMASYDRMVPLWINGVSADDQMYVAGFEIFNNSSYTQDMQVEFFDSNGAYQSVPLASNDAHLLGRYQAAKITVPANGRRIFYTYPTNEPLSLGYARIRRTYSSTSVEAVIHQGMQRGVDATGRVFTESAFVADGSGIGTVKYVVPNDPGSELVVTVTDSSSYTEVYTTLYALNDDGRVLCSTIVRTYQDNLVAATLRDNACFQSIVGSYTLELAPNHTGIHPAALFWSPVGGSQFLPMIPGN